MAGTATTIGLLAQELSRTNSWWRNSTWWKHDPDLLDAERLDLTYRSDCLAGLAPGGLYILRACTSCGVHGGSVEQQLGMALRRRLDVSAPGRWAEHDQILHVRTATRKEIDFVGPDLGQIAIESKYTESGAWRGEAATVIASEYFGILATRNVLNTQQGDAWAVPAAMLAYLIDT